MTTAAEYEIAFYKRETSSTVGDLKDLKKLYYDLRVGVNSKTSTQDKELAYLRTKTGLTTGSIRDLQAVYWASVVGANKGAGQQARYDYYRLAPVGH